MWGRCRVGTGDGSALVHRQGGVPSNEDAGGVSENEGVGGSKKEGGRTGAL